MDILSENSALQMWLLQYGSIALFFLLSAGVIILPIPEETLMVIAGILMHQKKLEIPQTVIAAYLGAFTGITGSYLLGRWGGYLIHRYGSWFGIVPKHINKGHELFKKYGKWAIFFGYYIPGIRHFTGIAAGITVLDFRHFALVAYTGAFLWVSIFLTIGYFFGEYWF